MDCPKCGGTSARYRKSVYDLTLWCLCGYSKVVFSTLDNQEIPVASSPESVKLPRPGTRLRKTLYAVDCLEEGDTASITQRLRDMREDYTASDVASYLTILRSKGLTVTTVSRRGVSGGSNWTVSDSASDLLDSLN
jgi:hypothetical protein